MLLQQLMQANIFCLSDKHLELRNNKTLRVGYNAEVFMKVCQYIWLSQDWGQP